MAEGQKEGEGKQLREELLKIELGGRKSVKPELDTQRKNVRKRLPGTINAKHKPIDRLFSDGSW